MSLSIDTQIKQKSSKFARGSWGILRYKLQKVSKYVHRGYDVQRQRGTLLILRKRKTSTLYYVRTNFVEERDYVIKRIRQLRLGILLEKGSRYLSSLLVKEA